MPNETIIAIGVTALTATIGWVIAHRFTSSRDLMNKRRELRLHYLTIAFRDLVSCGRRENDPHVDLAAVESAIHDLQLFGDEEQVKKTLAFVSNVDTAAESVDVSGLIVQLKNSIRRELGLRTVEAPFILAHFGRERYYASIADSPLPIRAEQ